MDSNEQKTYCNQILTQLGLPKKYRTECLKLYNDFQKHNRRCTAHFNDTNMIKMCVLFIARKNDEYVISSEILDPPSMKSSGDQSYIANNRELRSIYRKLKIYLNNPDYLLFSTGKYLDRLCKILDLTHHDIGEIIHTLEENETPITILKKLHDHMGLDMKELSKAKPNVTPASFSGKD